LKWFTALLYIYWELLSFVCSRSIATSRLSLPQLAMDEDQDTVRLRVACDRCHSQKLRCPKAAGADTCDRCSKARTPCVFSPFRQKKEPCNENPKGRASMDAQLARLEERIGTVRENNRNAVAKFDAQVGSGAKRKRTASVQRDTNCWFVLFHKTPGLTTQQIQHQKRLLLTLHQYMLIQLFVFLTPLVSIGHLLPSQYSMTSTWGLHLMT
jgi:hypothetical protein